jgi:hypothetical protein
MIRKIKILVDYYWNKITNRSNMIRFIFTNNPFQYNDLIKHDGEYLRCLKDGWFVRVPNEKIESCLEKSGEI